MKRSLTEKGMLSLGKAAGLAGAKSKWEMLMLLSMRGVPLKYAATNANGDLRMLKAVLGREIAISNSASEM